MTTRDEAIKAAADALIDAAKLVGWYEDPCMAVPKDDETRAKEGLVNARAALLALVSPGCDGCRYNRTPMPVPVRCHACARYPHGDHWEATP